MSVAVLNVVGVTDRAERRHAGRHAAGVGRIAAVVALVAVAEAVAVVIDADAKPGARRHAGEGDLLARACWRAHGARLGERRLARPVGLEVAAADVEAAALLAADAPLATRSHSPASARCSSR